MTKREAVEKWVSGFNAIPQGVIEKLGQDEVTEITPVCIGESVYIYSVEYDGDGTVTEKQENDIFAVCVDDSKIIHIEEDNIERMTDDWLPMWGTMWTFGEPLDNNWLSDNDNLQKMADCGFRIYEQDDFGYVFGINGAGYDFYTEHWIPLYDARGLKWHDE